MIRITEIKKAITHLLKQIHDIDVFYTNVSKTDSANQDEKIDQYYFVSLIPISTSLFGGSMRDRAFYIDISYVHGQASNNDYMLWSESMDNLFLPYIKIDKRSVTIEESSFKIVDQVAHYTFTLKFRDVVDYTEDGIPADELQINFK